MTSMTITRKQLRSGKYRYELNGEVHTAESRRLYTHASVYASRDSELPIVFLHAREDLAAKGSPDANRIVAAGAWRRVPGVVEIGEVS